MSTSSYSAADAYMRSAIRVSRPLTKQTLVIQGWLPDPLANVHADHWRIRERKLKIAQATVWAAAKQAGWQRVEGRARLTIVLVFGNQRRRDTDNLYARCKGVIDGLVKGGWIKDDSSEWLDLRVRAEVERGVRETRIGLEPL